MMKNIMAKPVCYGTGPQWQDLLSGKTPRLPVAHHPDNWNTWVGKYGMYINLKLKTTNTKYLLKDTKLFIKIVTW